MHPATLILMWCVSVVLFSTLPLFAMLAAAGVMLLLAAVSSLLRLKQLLRRTRWIMLSLLWVYAYTTAGQPLISSWGGWSPTLEGLGDGVLQLSRLLAALSGLAILLHQLHRSELIAGLYQLFIPLQWLGIARERLAVRLALTLQYAEIALLREQNSSVFGIEGLFQTLEKNSLPPPGAHTHYIEIHASRFGYWDAFLLSLGVLAILMVWLR